MQVFGIIVIIAGAIVLLAGIAMFAQTRSYDACSADVKATIIRKRKRNQKNGVSIQLTVTYTVAGIEYTKVVGALLSEYKALSEGDIIDLKYKPDNPKKAVRPKQIGNDRSLTVLMVGLLLAVVGVVVLLLL